MSIVFEIVAGWTDFLVSDPRLETVQRHRLVVIIEFVGEQFAPCQQERQISDTEDADTSYKPAVTFHLTPV